MRVNSGMSFALAEPLAVMQCRAGRIRPQRDVISTLHARCHFYLAPTPRAGCDTIGLAVRIAPGPNGRLGSTRSILYRAEIGSSGSKADSR